MLSEELSFLMLTIRKYDCRSLTKAYKNEGLPNQTKAWDFIVNFIKSHEQCLPGIPRNSNVDNLHPILLVLFKSRA